MFNTVVGFLTWLALTSPVFLAGAIITKYPVAAGALLVLGYCLMEYVGTLVRNWIDE